MIPYRSTHPVGFKGSVGFRDFVIGGPANIPDLGFNNGFNQVILAATFLSSRD